MLDIGGAYDINGVFNCCRISGWTDKDIELFNDIAWNHNITVQELFSLDACAITDHTLIHVADNIC